jgi:hypothetical protein
MGDDTCSVILRIWHEDTVAVTQAFGEEPDATEIVDDDDSGLLRLLVYEETVPDPLSQLVAKRVAFDGRSSNRFHSPGQLFASLDGELRAIDHPYCIVTIPIDIATLAIDRNALAAVHAFRELAARVDEHFRVLTQSHPPGVSGQAARSSTAARGERHPRGELTCRTARQEAFDPEQHAEMLARRDTEQSRIATALTSMRSPQALATLAALLDGARGPCLGRYARAALREALYRTARSLAGERP